MQSKENTDTKQAVITALYKRIRDLEEINEAHQKLNGKLRLQIAEKRKTRHTTSGLDRRI